MLSLNNNLSYIKILDHKEFDLQIHPIFVILKLQG